MTEAQQIQYLSERGWTRSERRDAWEWAPPHTEGLLYRLADAVSLQLSQDRSRQEVSLRTRINARAARKPQDRSLESK